MRYGLLARGLVAAVRHWKELTSKLAIFWLYFGIFSDIFSQLNYVENIYIIFHFHIWLTWSHSGCLTEFLQYGMSPRRHIYWTLNYWKFHKIGVFFTDCVITLCLIGANQLFLCQVIFIAIGLSQKNLFFDAHTRHIEVVKNIQKFRDFGLISKISNFSTAQICVLCVSHKFIIYFVRIPHSRST